MISCPFREGGWPTLMSTAMGSIAWGLGLHVVGLGVALETRWSRVSMA